MTEHVGAASAPRGAAVAAEAPEAVAAARTILEAGGNAVDAAVGAAFALCVVHPAATTVAGSGFLMLDDAAGGRWAVDFPPRAPRAATADMFELATATGGAAMMGVTPVVDRANDVGPLAIGVPGVVRGLCAANERFGGLPLRTVLEPAIALAQDGFETHPELQLATLAAAREMRADPQLAEVFLDGDGLPPVGDLGFRQSGAPMPSIRQPALARVLEAVARDGAAAWSAGPLAVALTGDLERRGGILRAADLASYTPTIAQALSVDVGGHRLWMPNAPCGAWTVAQILLLWERLAGDPDDGRDIDLRVQAAKHAFADRYHFLGDPDFAGVPLDTLLSSAYVDDLASRVRDGDAPMRFDADAREPWVRFASERPHDLSAFAAQPAHVPPAPTSSGPGDSPETTHLCVVDADGMTVSCTTTAANSFGSRTMSNGVLFDDAMIWFNAAPGYVNSIAPWKRPLVNMAPMLVERRDGALLAVGAPGGRRIINAVAEVIHRWLRHDPVGSALAAPRFDASGRAVLVSDRMEPGIRTDLARRGNPVETRDDRDPFSYEFARPVVAAREVDGGRVAGIHPFCRGTAVAWEMPRGSSRETR